MPFPTDILAPFIGSVTVFHRYDQLYNAAVVPDSDGAAVMRYSKYEYRNSRYYAGNESVFDTHIPAVAELVAKELFKEDTYLSSFVTSASYRAYVGLCSHLPYDYKIELRCRPLEDSPLVRKTCTAAVKLCENNIRLQLGIKSSYKKIDVPENIGRIIAEYFDKVMPERSKKRAKSDVEDYMKLYEPEESGKADISRALDIERKAWQTAVDLEGEPSDENEPPQSGDIPELDDFGSCGDFSDLKAALTEQLIGALSAALDGRFALFCRENGIIFTEAERLINEASYDAVGDAVMSGGEIIDDYREDIEKMIKETK